MKGNDPFWLNDPKILYTNLVFLPTNEMTLAERLNAVTRSLLLVVLGMYMSGHEHYLTVLILGLAMIIVMYSNGSVKEGFRPRRGVHDPCRTCGGDSSMAYINSKYETTPLNQFSHVNDGLRSYTHAHYKVIPLDTPAPYREVWRNEPRFCNEFSEFPSSYVIPPANNSDYRWINLPDRKCSFEDTRWVDNTWTGKGARAGKRSAAPAIQSAFMRDSSEYRNNIMGEYIDFFGRQRQHNCVNFKPGRATF